MMIFRDALPDGKSGDFVIVRKSQLFQKCPTCLTSNVLHEIKTSGTHMSVITKCDEHENRWESKDCWHAGEQLLQLLEAGAISRKLIEINSWDRQLLKVTLFRASTRVLVPPVF